MEQFVTQTPLREVNKIAVFSLRVLTYIPTLWIAYSFLGAPAFLKGLLTEASSPVLIILWGLVAIVIPWLISSWLINSYKKRRNLSLGLAVLFLLIWLGIAGFAAYGANAMSQFAQSTSTRPDCRSGYGYTISLGPADGPIYSKCRPGPNKNNYPVLNY